MAATTYVCSIAHVASRLDEDPGLLETIVSNDDNLYPLAYLCLHHPSGEGREDVRIVGDRFVFSSEVLFPPGSADLSVAGRGPEVATSDRNAQKCPGTSPRHPR